MHPTQNPWLGVLVSMWTGLKKSSPRLAGVVAIAGIFGGIYLLVNSIKIVGHAVEIAGTTVHLAYVQTFVFLFGFIGAVVIVWAVEGKTRVQRIFMPGADENRSMLDWVGRLFRSRSEKRKPLTDLSPQIKAIEKDAMAMAVLAGLGMIAAAIRALGRLILLALIFLAIAWSIAPFPASFAPS